VSLQGAMKSKFLGRNEIHGQLNFFQISWTSVRHRSRCERLPAGSRGWVRFGIKSAIDQLSSFWRVDGGSRMKAVSLTPRNSSSEPPYFVDGRGAQPRLQLHGIKVNRGCGAGATRQSTTELKVHCAESLSSRQAFGQPHSGDESNLKFKSALQ
jgi:hypothetical protein